MLCQEQRRTDSKRGAVVPVTFSFKANLTSISKKEKQSGERKFAVVLMFVRKPPTLPCLRKLADNRVSAHWGWGWGVSSIGSIAYSIYIR